MTGVGDIQPLGDRALRVHTPQAAALSKALAAQPPEWLCDQAPALDVLVVYLQPWAKLTEAWQDIEQRLQDASEQLATQSREHVIPVRYDGSDLDDVAHQTGLSVSEVVRRHTEAVYRVEFLGFTPGFAFLSGTPPELQRPRRATPRLSVPAGSLALGGPWSGIYPFASPGGWHLIGRVEVQLFDVHRDPPALFAPGDVVRFQPL